MGRRPSADGDAVKAAAQHDWNCLLGRIRVSGGSYAQTQEFYSLLYKDFLQPNITSDVNGQFLGANAQVQSLAAGQQNHGGEQGKHQQQPRQLKRTSSRNGGQRRHPLST